ncbi:MAG: hypothetical protein ACRC7N_18375 [Clostridium sp.]
MIYLYQLYDFIANYKEDGTAENDRLDQTIICAMIRSKGVSLNEFLSNKESLKWFENYNFQNTVYSGIDDETSMRDLVNKVENEFPLNDYNGGIYIN